MGGAVGFCFVYRGTLTLGEKIQVCVTVGKLVASTVLWVFLGRRRTHSSPPSVRTRFFLLPPKPQMCPLCHLVMNAQLRDKKAEELCSVSTV